MSDILEDQVRELLDTVDGLNGSLEGLGEGSDGSRTFVEGFGDAAKHSTQNLMQFTSQIVSGTADIKAVGDTFAGITKSIGDVVPVVGGLITGFGKLTSTAVDMFQDSFESYQSLSDVGLVGAEGIDGLRDAAYGASLPLKEYSAILQKNANELAYINGSAIKGSKNFGKTITMMMEPANAQLRNLGYTIEETTDVVISYQKIQQRLGFQQVVSQDELVKSANEYGYELDALAKLTGVSRKEQMAERDKMLSDSRFRAFLVKVEREQGKDAAEAHMQFAQQLGATSKEAQQAYQDSVAGFITTDAAIAATVSGLTSSFHAFKRSVDNGDTSMANVNNHFNNVADAAKVAAKWQETLAAVAGDGINGLFKYNQLMDLAGKAQVSDTKFRNDILPALKLEAEAQKNGTAAAVKMTAIIKKATATFNKLFLEVFPVGESLDWLSEKMESAADYVGEFINNGGLDDVMSDLRDFGNVLVEVGRAIKDALIFLDIIDEDEPELELKEDTQTEIDRGKDRIQSLEVGLELAKKTTQTKDIEYKEKQIIKEKEKLALNEKKYEELAKSKDTSEERLLRRLDYLRDKQFEHLMEIAGERRDVAVQEAIGNTGLANISRREIVNEQEGLQETDKAIIEIEKLLKALPSNERTKEGRAEETDIMKQHVTWNPLNWYGDSTKNLRKPSEKETAAKQTPEEIKFEKLQIENKNKLKRMEVENQNIIGQMQNLVKIAGTQEQRKELNDIYVQNLKNIETMKNSLKKQALIAKETPVNKQAPMAAKITTSPNQKMEEYTSTKISLENLIKSLDKNNDGLITKEEYNKSMENLNTRDLQKKLISQNSDVASVFQKIHAEIVANNAQTKDLIRLSEANISVAQQNFQAK